MNTHVTMAVLLTRPGPLRHSLKALLDTLSEIEIVAEAKDLSVLQRLGYEIQPDLILLEAGLPGNGLSDTIQQIKKEWKQTRSIVLVETREQEVMALAAGANLVLFTGHRANDLVSLIRGLLAEGVDQGVSGSTAR